MRRTLRPLVRVFARTVAAALVRRAIAWLACALVVLSLGAVAAALFGLSPPVRLGLILAALSSLPAFLFWPQPASALEARLRSVDDDTVIESWLEAPPGPARQLLAELAGQRIDALPFRALPREPPLRGLGGLLLAALAVLGSVQVISLAAWRRPLSLLAVHDQPVSVARRVEQEGFAELTGEDAASRLERWESRRAGEGASGSEGAEPGAAPGEQAAGIPASRRPRESSGDLARAERAGATEPDPGSGSGNGTAAALPGQEGLVSTSPSAPAEGGGGKAPRPTSASGSSRGYDRTGDTLVPSPLLEYRTRFASVYAERTGKNIRAGDRLELGELRDYQRSLFHSFAFEADIAPAEDPYVALLKHRWSERKGGSP